MRRICWAYGLSRWLNVHLPRLQMEFFRFFSAPSPHPSVPVSTPLALSKFLQTFCILAVCHFAVAWQWSDKTKDVAGCMANGLQEESSALLRPSSCSALALLLPGFPSAPTLPLSFVQPVPILLPLVNVWAVSERRIAPSCVARRPLVMHTLMKGDVFVFFFVVPLLSCHCCYFLLLLAIKSMFGQQLACAIHSLYSL